MTRFLIEVSQVGDRLAHKRISDSVRTMGSHFVTHADWAERDGIQTGTMTIEAPDDRQAFAVVPPALRSYARVMRLDALKAA